MRKRVVITADLVDESVACSDATIHRDLFEWFKDAMAPWIREIKTIAVRSS